MTNTVYAILIAIALIAFCVAYVLTLSLLEQYREYNKGKCSECGRELRYLNKNLYGDRTYICDTCKHIVTVTWKCVDKRRRKSK